VTELSLGFGDCYAFLRAIVPRKFEIPSEHAGSVDLRAPNSSSVLTRPIRHLDLIVFAQFLPLRSIGADFDRAAVVAHPDFYDPLVVIGRPLIFDFLALFDSRDVILPDHDCVPTFLFAGDQTHCE
jgi:hypothetical protein